MNSGSHSSLCRPVLMWQLSVSPYIIPSPNRHQLGLYVLTLGEESHRVA